MPVNTIIYQPATAQLMAAYRPVVFKVQATSTTGEDQPPYVVCDIYLADVYYKSLIRTAPETVSDDGSTYQFDISDALQEYMQPDIAAVDNNNLLQAPHSSAKVFCRFRASYIDDDGFTVEEGIKPVQGTKHTAPVAGTGTQSETFFAINSALQHEDNMNLAAHLASYKTGTWSSDAFPLTHRSKYFFCPGDSDHFHFIFRGDCVAADIKLNYRLKGSSSWLQATAEDINVCEGIDYEVTVNGNQVTVTLDESVPANHTALIQYRKQGDTVWIDAGTMQQIETEKSFYVNGEDIAGDYDIRVIHFCTPCLPADPVVHEFELDGSEINLAWRGIDPFCVVVPPPETIYIAFDLRNETTQTEYIPNNVEPEQVTTDVFRDLYVQFFSDAARLTPLNVVQNGLMVFARLRRVHDDFSNSENHTHIDETAMVYTIDANGVEAFIQNVQISKEVIYGFPTVSASESYEATWEPYPDIQLAAGKTGDSGYATLQEYNTDTNLPTGETKPNDFGDPDYIAPSFKPSICPPGADATYITFGNNLNVSKVQINWNVTSNLYVESVADTDLGGYQFVKQAPRNTDLTLSVKAKTLDSGNTNGYVKCRVTYIDSAGAAQVAVFNVPNDIETTLPQVFRNVNIINITNF